MTERILVVDDEPGMALAMAQVLRRADYDVETAPDGEQALDRLAHRPFDLVVTDLRMPGCDGRAVLQRIRTLRPATRVVMVTAYATVESAVACVRDGAVDYLMKPFAPDALLGAVQAALCDVRTAPTAPADDDVVANDPAIVATLDLARRAAARDVTVLLEAESGAGKEVVARLIHRESPRREGPFVAVNCAALPRELLEAELFGHARGAFTGAHRDRKGQFQTADGGTLLLDEIGEMHPDLQARLLRVLQDRTIRPVGTDDPVPVDVRVIAATNRDLRRAVADGDFREDLYYRLRVMPIRIPPLRERPADIEPLARRFAAEFGDPGTELTDAALRRLCAHDWPGNVRELQNVVQRAVILADGRIDPEHLELETSPSTPDPGRPAPESFEEAERETLRRALERTRGNRARAAEALGISPRTLRHKLKRFRDLGRPVPLPEVAR